MVLRGYRLQGTDLTGITQEIKKISMSVNKIRARTYAKLLGNEIAFLVDKIALNVYTRDPTVSIYECACSRTEEEIRVAQLQGLKTPYNLQVYGQVFTEADYTYFAISCMQNEFLKAFHRLEEYSVSESEYEDPNNSKTKLWKSLMEKTATPMTINFGNGIPQIAKDQIVYPTKKERCRTEARHQVCNRILNQVSFGKQIPPECLMKNIDQMMKILLQEESQKEIAAKEKDPEKVRQANEFAAALLMPRYIFFLTLEAASDIAESGKRTIHMQAVADFFNVSLSAAYTRAKDFGII